MIGTKPCYILVLVCIPLLLVCLGTAQEKNPAIDCSEVAAIHHMPFHREEAVNDPAYNHLRAKSWAVVPCLIDEITNKSLTPDPRSAPTYPKVRVGDVSFWVIVDITGLPYDAMFPPDLVKRFPKEGVYAYFEWVNRDGNRQKLQSGVRRWCSANRPR